MRKAIANFATGNVQDRVHSAEKDIERAKTTGPSFLNIFVHETLRIILAKEVRAA